MPRNSNWGIPSAQRGVWVDAHPRRGTKGVRSHRRKIYVQVPIGASHPALARVLFEREHDLNMQALYEADPGAYFENPLPSRYPRNYPMELHGALVRMLVRER